MPYLDLGDEKFWFELDRGTEPLVVFLHGAAGSSECWVQQLPAFREAGFRCLTYDLRGFGRSEADKEHETQGSIAGDLEEMAWRLALPPFFLVAQAYGGFGAIEYAIDNPETVRALVVSTSFGGVTEPEYTALRTRHLRPDLDKLSTVEKELGASYRASDPEGVARFLEMEAKGYKSDAARQQLRTPTTYARLEAMSVPALIIAADEDLYAPPPVMQAFAERIPGSCFEVIAGAGHCAYWEKPDEWNATVLKFLQEQAGV